MTSWMTAAGRRQGQGRLAPAACGAAAARRREFRGKAMPPRGDQGTGVGPPNGKSASMRQDARSIRSASRRRRDPRSSRPKVTKRQGRAERSRRGARSRPPDRASTAPSPCHQSATTHCEPRVRPGAWLVGPRLVADEAESLPVMPGRPRGGERGGRDRAGVATLRPGPAAQAADRPGPADRERGW